MSDGTRTRDHLDHNQVLYQLSYTHHGPQINEKWTGGKVYPCVGVGTNRGRLALKIQDVAGANFAGRVGVGAGLGHHDGLAVVAKFGYGFAGVR